MKNLILLSSFLLLFLTWKAMGVQELEGRSERATTHLGPDYNNKPQDNSIAILARSSFNKPNKQDASRTPLMDAFTDGVQTPETWNNWKQEIHQLLKKAP
ncbi:MAG: hypothetical protein R8P61_15315 [Bacteroidia bacterium]|nr:hypothetical protein [Bacteroidia bacterium]